MEEVEDLEEPKPRRLPWVVFAVVLAAVVAATVWVAGGEGDLRPAPAFSLENLRGGDEPVVLPVGRPAVVNFFASWCEPCKRELPALQSAFREHRDRVAFIGIDHQDAAEDGLDMLDDAGVTYSAGYDPRGRVAASFRLRGLPATVFLTADGRVLETVHGELDRAAVDRRIERLIALREEG